MMSVLDRVSGDIEKVLADDMKSATDPKKKLEVFVSVCFDVVRNTKEYYQVSMDFWTQINQKEKVKGVISSHYKKFRDQAGTVIQEGIDSGDFRSVEVHDYASYVIAVIDGLSLQWLFDEKIFNYDGICKLATHLILDGLEKK